MDPRPNPSLNGRVISAQHKPTATGRTSTLVREHCISLTEKPQKRLKTQHRKCEKWIGRWSQFPHVGRFFGELTKWSSSFKNSPRNNGSWCPAVAPPPPN
jgi:hypothetical protein